MSENYILNIHTDNVLSIDDPISWALENVNNPILERARQGLLSLSSEPDPARILRLVVRRCGVNLIEIHEGRIVIHYWGQKGLGNLRPFFKERGLSKSESEVVLIDRKRESMIFCPANDFLYGVAPSNSFPWEGYERKWEKRFVEESDYWDAAPRSFSFYLWENVAERKIPWAVLKAAWRRDECPTCHNCEVRLLMLSFCWQKGSLQYQWICLECHRLFELRPQAWVWERLCRFLDETLLPSHIQWWGTTDLRIASSKRRAFARVGEQEEGE